MYADTLQVMKDDKTPDSAPEEVQLKQIAGIRPGVYLTILYALIILALLTVVLILPGIRRPGSVLEITSVPDGAAVYIDGQYQGATPVSCFADKGSRTIQLKKEGFDFPEEQIRVDSRIFASKFFPKREQLHIETAEVADKALYRDLFTELSSYALIDRYTENYQAPPLITDYVQDMLDTKAVRIEQLQEQLFQLLPNISSEELFDDMAHAYSLIEEVKGNSIVDLKKAKALLITELSEYLPLSENIISAAIKEGSSFGKRSSGGELTNRIYSNKIARKLSIEGVRFIALPEAYFEDALLDRTSTFFLSEQELSRSSFSRFLSENPEWRLENRQELMEQGLVDENYLADWGESFRDTASNMPLRYVSWYAAKAYCDWLNESLPGDLPEKWEVRLPTEEEWEAAHILNGESREVNADNSRGPRSPSFERQGEAGLYDMGGNLWEWCEQWYFPLERLYRLSGKSITIPEGAQAAEKVVKGGSWANKSQTVPFYLRGKQEPQWCSPFLGFRPALVQK